MGNLSASKRVAEWGETHGLADRLVASAGKSADPRQALVNLDALLASGVEPTSASLDDLLGVFGGSQALSRFLLVDPGSRLPWFAEAIGVERIDRDGHLAELETATGDRLGEASFLGVLREHKQRHLLRIGARDLSGRAGVEATVRELSALAEASVEMALRHARARLVEEYGAPRGEPSFRFVVLGMGKLGGEELNYSSDVDLVYLYEGGSGPSAGGTRGTLEPLAWASRLAEILTRAIHDVTEDGFVFRVDLRLRPDGQNGPIVNALAGALTYYESWGKTWERTAMLKARPIAGDITLGDEFLEEMRPFVFRRFLDFETIDEIQAMKARIDSAASSRERLTSDVKLGPGGIREIEFIVQVHQLVHGGRDERVRVRPTLEALEALAATGVLAPETARDLAAAYRFLRDVEHKIQVAEERQTQRLPTDPTAFALLARRLGEEGPEALRSALALHRGVVRAFFEKLFLAEPETKEDPRIRDLLDEIADRDATARRLGAMGFRNPVEAASHLWTIREGGTSSRPSPRRYRVLSALAPALLAELGAASDPDLALAHMADFVTAVGARTSFLALLLENRATLRLLVGLFGTSPVLSGFFIRHPELLDSLVRADLAQVRKSPDDLRDEVRSLLAPAADYESSLDTLRRFRNEEFLRIGVNDIHGLLAPEDVAGQLSDLADVSIEAALEIARGVVRERFGKVEGRFVVVGMGKLGGRDLGYSSDLDLVFVYDGPPPRGDGPTTREIFTKLAQRFISVLQVRTPEGIVYPVDTRLRPSGSAGPLVSSLEAFRKYHEEHSQVWERQALTRARPVAGETSLRDELAAMIEGFVYGRGLDVKEVTEIRRLRARMEDELAKETSTRWNIKTGKGGVVDVEFVVQMLQLRHGHDRPPVRARETRVALDALHDEGILPESSRETLRRGYDFLRRIEGGLRIQKGQPVEIVDIEAPGLDVLARQLGYVGDAVAISRELVDGLREAREGIRHVFDEVFGSAA